MYCQRTMFGGICLRYFVLHVFLFEGLQSSQWSPKYSPSINPFFQRNTASGSIIFYPQLPDFPAISIPDNAKDSCFPRIKAAFDRAFPGLPTTDLKTNDVTGAQPIPRYVSQLPPFAQPVYARETGPIFVPYKLPTSEFPMYVALDRNTKQPIYPELKALLPYAKLATVQRPYGRKYVVYLPFQPDAFRNSSCGEPIYIPFPNREGEFFFYRQYSLNTAPPNADLGRKTLYPSHPSLRLPQSGDFNLTPLGGISVEKAVVTSAGGTVAMFPRHPVPGKRLSIQDYSECCIDMLSIPKVNMSSVPS